jgi:hypothetical protein
VLTWKIYTAPRTFTPTYQEKIAMSMTESLNTVNFDTALRTLAAQAASRYAGETARIDRGLLIALNGGVTLLADGTADVRSQSDAEIVYHVNGHCDCVDAGTRAPEGRCKHKWAKCLTKRAISLLAATAVQPSRSCAPQPVRWYASYVRPDGESVQGIATHTPHGYLFAAEDGSVYEYVSTGALVLGGNVAILEAQRLADGNLIDKICRHNGAASR